MPLEIRTEAVGLGQVLRSMRLAVPIHQREFAWTDDEVKQLWEDIQRARREEPDGYFVGPMVLSKNEPPVGRLWIIDGQQRSATVSILLAAIVSVFRERGDADRAPKLTDRFLFEEDLDTLDEIPKLVLGDDDDPFYQNLVSAAANGGPLPEPAQTKESHGLLRAAYDFLLAQVVAEAGDGTDWRERLLSLASFIETSLEVILVTVDTDQNAYLIFETLNDRGLRLTTADLLKNHLFGKAGTHLESVRRRWIEMQRTLEPISATIDTTEFLRHHWISSRGHVRSRELYRTIRREVATALAANELAGELSGASDVYASLLLSTHPRWHGAAPIVRESFDAIRLLRVVTPRPLLLAAAEELDDQEFAGVLDAVTRWSVRMAIAGGLGSGTVEEAYGEAARAIRAGTISDVAGLRVALEDILPKDAVFEAAFAVKPIRNAAQARFYLGSLEALARDDDGLTDELNVNRDPGSVNLEHIMPLSPGPDWTAVTTDEINIYAARIGNMALMLTTDNAAAANSGFDDKKQYYAASELVLTSELSGYGKWGPEQILERQKRLAALAVRVWPL